MKLQEMIRTVRKNGGLTLNGATLLPVSSGFVVSPYLDRERKLANLTELKLASYIIEHRELLRQPGRCLGVWVNQDDGLTYLDVTVVTRSREEAETLCRLHKQIAYFDLDKMEEVRP